MAKYAKIEIAFSTSHCCFILPNFPLAFVTKESTASYTSIPMSMKPFIIFAIIIDELFTE